MAHPEIRVLHLITRLILGGAQENTILTADGLLHEPAYAGHYAVDIACGCQTGLEGQLHDQVHARKIPLSIIPELVREISPRNDLVALVKIVRLLSTGHYTILHTHSTKAGFLGRLAAWLAGTPVVVHTVHGWSFHTYMSAWLRHIAILLERLLAPLSHKLIVVSLADQVKGLHAGISSSEHYTMIRSGIELDRFGHPSVAPDEMRRRLGLPKEGLIVGSVTRFSAQKAPLDLLAMFAQVASHVPDALLVIVGDGPLRPQLESSITQLGLSDRVHLLGLRRDVPEVMACFDLFVLTSLWEGLPRVLPQAMASGLAVVATAVDGSAEIVKHGINGYLCPPGQPEELARRAVELLSQPALRLRMGQAGRQSAAAFGAKQMVGEIEHLYRVLLAEETVKARSQTMPLPRVRNQPLR